MTPQDFLRRFGAVAGDEARAEFLADFFAARGEEVYRDEEGNLWVGGGPVAFAAHIDTVLEPRPLTIEEERWWGPAVGDNSSGVAVLATAWERVPEGASLAFTVGEEGLGNLRGARAFVRERRPAAFVAVDGYLGSLVTRALGSVRYEVRFLAAAGHSWGDRSAPNPAWALGRMIQAVQALPCCEGASRSVARVWGGGAINAIPEEVGLALDVRAVDPVRLDEAERRIRTAAMEAAHLEQVETEVQLLGRRPAGSTADADLLACARGAGAAAGVALEEGAGSTDMAAAVEQGIPAITLGVYRGGGAHTEAEWVDPASLDQGVALLRAFWRCYGGRAASQT